MAESESNQRVETQYQRLSEGSTSFGSFKKIRARFHVRGNWWGTGGLKARVSDSAQYQPTCKQGSSPRSNTVLVHTHDHATLQVIRDFLEPLGFKVEVLPAPDAHSEAAASGAGAFGSYVHRQKQPSAPGLGCGTSNAGPGRISRRLVRSLPAVLPGPLAPSFGRVPRNPTGGQACSFTSSNRTWGQRADGRYIR